MRKLAAVLAAALAGCASPPLAGAPRVESRRFSVVSDVDPGALELALPILDAVDEDLTKRWGFEDRGRRELLLFADEPTWDAFEAAEKPDGERWHGSGFGLASGAGGAIALEVPPRSRGDDLSQVSFEQVRRLDDAVEVVSRVTRELFLCRLRERLGPKAFKARDEQLVRGAGELERTAAMARLDGGLEAPYEPGRSEVERALGALALALHLRPVASFEASDPKVAERERALGCVLFWPDGEVRQHLLAQAPGELPGWIVKLAAGLPDSGSRLQLQGESTPSTSTATSAPRGELLSLHPDPLSDALETLVLRDAADRLIAVVLRHPSERYVRAAGPALRVIAALLGLPSPEGADPVGWRAAAAELEARLARWPNEREEVPPRLEPGDLDALLLELGVRERQRKEWLREFCGET